jgi:hypothetical protein
MRTLSTVMIAGMLLTGITVEAQGRQEGDRGNHEITTGEFQLADTGSQDEAGRKGFEGVNPQISGTPFCRPAFRIPPARRCVVPRHQRSHDASDRDDDDRSGGHDRSKVCIDLSQDADGDGLPDALVAAIDHIRNLAPSKQNAAILDMVSRLPYSQRTLNLAAEAAVATLQLEACNPTDAQQNQLAKKLQSLLDAMMTDPEYVRAQEAIQAILEKDFEIKFPVPPPPGVPACELTETPSGRACVAFNLSERQFCALKQLTVGPKFCAIETSPTPPVRPPDEFGWAHIAMGDIILRRAKDSFWQTLGYAIFYTHSGNWHGDRQVYEAVRKGVVLSPLDVWFTEADDVAIGINNVHADI